MTEEKPVEPDPVTFTPTEEAPGLPPDDPTDDETEDDGADPIKEDDE